MPAQRLNIIGELKILEIRREKLQRSSKGFEKHYEESWETAGCSNVEFHFFAICKNSAFIKIIIQIQIRTDGG